MPERSQEHPKNSRYSKPNQIILAVFPNQTRPDITERPVVSLDSYTVYPCPLVHFILRTFLGQFGLVFVFTKNI